MLGTKFFIIFFDFHFNRASIAQVSVVYRNQKKELIRHAPKRKHIAFIKKKKKAEKAKASEDFEGPAAKKARTDKTPSSSKVRSDEGTKKKSLKVKKSTHIHKAGNVDSLKTPSTSGSTKLKKKGKTGKLKKINK